MERKNQNADKFGGGRPSNHTFQGGQGAGKSTWSIDSENIKYYETVSSDENAALHMSVAVTTYFQAVLYSQITQLSLYTQTPEESLFAIQTPCSFLNGPFF